MTEQRDRSASEAVDRLIESRRSGEGDASPSEQPNEASDLATLAASLESRWSAQPPVDEDAIWQRVNVGMRSTPQSRPRRWSRFPSALASLSLPATLPAWLTVRTPALITGTLALVLVVLATFATQRPSANAAFVTDVESLARFTAAVLNDEQLSPDERGEVERRASGLLSVVQANPSVLAGLDGSEAELVVARIDGILTLLEPYEDDHHGGVETSIVPLASVRAQVEGARGPSGRPPAAFSTETADPSEDPSSTPATSEVGSPTPSLEQRGAAQPQRTPDATATPSDAPSPGTGRSPSAVPGVEGDGLRALCGNERESRQGRCRAAMAQLQSACVRDVRSERCEEAFEDAIDACRQLRDDAATRCERVLLALATAFAPDGERRGGGGEDNSGNRDDGDDRGGGTSRGGGSSDDRSDDGSGRSGDDDDRDGAGNRSEDEDSEDDSGDDDDDRANSGRWFGRGRGGGDSR